MRFLVMAGTVMQAAVTVSEPPPVASKAAYLENEAIRIGVDLSSGGAIFWFSEAEGGPNLLNHADRGRFIQQSYYGADDGSKWAEQPWRWNPVQGGHYLGKAAKVLESKAEKTSLYVRSVPVHWARGDLLEDCLMEEWIELKGKVAEVRFRFEYKGEQKHPARHQELPAVFVDHALNRLVYYHGKEPWQGRELTRQVPGWPNEARRCDEEWAAYVGADGKGVGVYFPGTPEITSYRFQGSNSPAGSGCSYFAPVRTFAIEPGKVHDYRIYLRIGTAEEIRDSFGKIRRERLAEGKEGVSGK